MKYNELNDEQLIELAKLRLKNDSDYKNISEESVQKITIEDKRQSEIHNQFAISFIVKSKKFADFRMAILFDKFYVNEFLYLQKIGVELK